MQMVPEGKRLFINVSILICFLFYHYTLHYLFLQDLSDLSNSKILCALVNSLVPGTFTSEVLLNDRYSNDNNQ